MKPIEWNSIKNDELIRDRGISFEAIVASELIAIKRHPRRTNQRVMVFRCKDYYWAVPFVEDENRIFLKTIYPSRKLRQEYEGG